MGAAESVTVGALASSVLFAFTKTLVSQATTEVVDRVRGTESLLDQIKDAITTLRYKELRTSYAMLREAIRWRDDSVEWNRRIEDAHRSAIAASSTMITPIEMLEVYTARVCIGFLYHSRNGDHMKGLQQIKCILDEFDSDDACNEKNNLFVEYTKNPKWDLLMSTKKFEQRRDFTAALIVFKMRCNKFIEFIQQTVVESGRSTVTTEMHDANEDEKYDHIAIESERIISAVSNVLNVGNVQRNLEFEELMSANWRPRYDLLSATQTAYLLAHEKYPECQYMDECKGQRAVLKLDGNIIAYKDQFFVRKTAITYSYKAREGRNHVDIGHKYCSDYRWRFDFQRNLTPRALETFSFRKFIYFNGVSCGYCLENAAFVRSIIDQMAVGSTNITFSPCHWVAVQDHHHEGSDFNRNICTMQQWIEEGDKVKFVVKG